MLKHYKPGHRYVTGLQAGQVLKLVMILTLILVSQVLQQAQAAARQIESFDGHTWQRWQKELPRPAAVVFSTTDCSHCPAVIAALSEQLKSRHIPVIVVVMDGEGVSDLLEEAHYAPAKRLFVFTGQTTALQYSISPLWRGITPYIALFPRLGEAQLVLGKPSPEQLRSWLKEEKNRP